MSEKIYKVQMNSKGAPDFSTAVEIADRPSDPHDITYFNALENRIRELEANISACIPLNTELPMSAYEIFSHNYVSNTGDKDTFEIVRIGECDKSNLEGADDES